MNRVKKIVRYLLFFGILAVIFLGLSRVFYPKENSVEAGMPPRDVKVNGIFGAENNSLDVIFFGDSMHNVIRDFFTYCVEKRGDLFGISWCYIIAADICRNQNNK